MGNKLRPTENALQLLDDVIDVLKRIDNIESRLQGTEHITTLEVGCNMSTGIELLPTAISVFENKYPNTLINVFEDSTPNVVSKLLTRELDFAIVSGNINNAKLSCKCFAEEPFCWICSADNPIAQEENVSIERLSKERLVLPGEDIVSFYKAGVPDMVELKPSWVTVNTITTLRAVMTMGYISHMPMNFVGELIENGQLKLIHTDMNMKRKLYIIYLRKHKLSRRIWEFVDICTSLITKDISDET